VNLSSDVINPDYDNPDSDSSFITVTSATTATYWVRASSPCATATSQGTVTVAAACPTPQFISTTDDRAAAPGELVTLASPAVGVTKYEWYEISEAGAWSPIVNANAATVDVTPQANTTYVAVGEQ